MTEDLVTEDQVPSRLEDWINHGALYAVQTIKFAEPQRRWPGLPERILRACDVCEAEPTWMLTAPYADGSVGSMVGRLAQGLTVTYTCTKCSKAKLTVFYVERPILRKSLGGGGGVGIPSPALVLGVVLTKTGQLPAPETKPDPLVDKGLSPAGRDFYRKGLRSLTHGFGIGALAYFRRVVEDATSDLLELTRNAARADGDQEALERLERAEEQQAMSDRLRLAAEALPPSLRPGGANPLRALYDQYSKGLHRRSEAECQEIASHLRFTLEYVFKNWTAQVREAERFRSEVAKWGNPSEDPGELTEPRDHDPQN